MKELIVTKWPNHKRPTLNVKDVDQNFCRILAYFRDDEAAREFSAMVRHGVQWQEDKE